MPQSPALTPARRSMLRRSSPIIWQLSGRHSSARRRRARAESAIRRDRDSRRLRRCASLRFMARCGRQAPNFSKRPEG